MCSLSVAILGISCKQENRSIKISIVSVSLRVLTSISRQRHHGDSVAGNMTDNLSLLLRNRGGEVIGHVVAPPLPKIGSGAWPRPAHASWKLRVPRRT